MFNGDQKTGACSLFHDDTGGESREREREREREKEREVTSVQANKRALIDEQQFKVNCVCLRICGRQDKKYVTKKLYSVS